MLIEKKAYFCLKLCKYVNYEILENSCKHGQKALMIINVNRVLFDLKCCKYVWVVRG